MKRFRYPGVRPFLAADRALFFGRDRDIADLYELVRAEPLVVLFGKSGYGKSSLLNAGVLPLFGTPEVRSGGDDVPSESTPEVRSGAPPSPERTSGVQEQEGDDWLVLETRFGEYTEGLSDTPLERLRQRLLEKIPTPAQAFPNLSSPQGNSLWLDFKQRLSPQNRRFLLVFDQFEEFFSYPPEQQAAFKDQLADLLYEEMPQAVRDAARSLERDERRALAARMEVKALFAIRSDRMSDLDRLKDRLPAILHKRYELRALSREQAREAIVQPALLVNPAPAPIGRGDVERSVENTKRIELQGDAKPEAAPLPMGEGSGVGLFSSPPFEYRDDALQKILDELSRSTAGADKSGGIESFQLQILCDDIDSRVANGLVPDRDGNGLPDVSAADLPDFSEVFARYYERRLALLDASGERSDDLKSSDRKARTSSDDSKSSDEYRTQKSSDEYKSGGRRAVARRVIEDGLVRYDAARDEGRRLSVDGQALLKDFEAAGLTPALLRELENTFLVRREPNTLGGHNYELSHDTLLAPVLSAKKKRLAEEERERLRYERERLARARRRNFAVGLAALLLLGFAFWQTYKAQQATAEADKAYRTAEEKKREADEAARHSKIVEQEAVEAIVIAELEKKNALTEQEKAEVERRRAAVEKRKAEALLEASKLMAAHKLPENFDALIPLDSLNCHDWRLGSLSPEIAKLQNLKVLDLSSNNLKSLPEEIGNLKNLQWLVLWSNPLTSLPGEIGNLTNLQWLTSVGSPLTSLPREIGKLQNLQSLDLSWGRLTNLPGEIGKLQNLQSLTLSHNQLTNLPGEIVNLKNLKNLQLSLNQLDSLPTGIGKLQNLKELDLSSNNLKSLPAEIGNLQNLQSLELSGNQLTSLPIETLKRLKSLKRLHLKDVFGSNPLPASEVEALRQAMPWCEVVWEE